MKIRRAALFAVLIAVLATAGCRSKAEPPKTPEMEPLPVSVVTMPEWTVLALPAVGSYAPAEIGATIERFFDYMEQKGLAPAGVLMGAYWDDPETTPPDQTRYEIRIPLAEPVTVEPPFEVKTIPATRTAATVLVGPYEAITARYGELFSWVEANGYRMAGPLVEVYLVHPGSGVPPTLYETEVHVPIEAAGE